MHLTLAAGLTDFSRIKADERLYFTFASYNAGFGGVLKARKRLREKKTEKPGAVNQWDKISPFAPAETRNYIRRIDELMQFKDN